MLKNQYLFLSHLIIHFIHYKCKRYHLESRVSKIFYCFWQTYFKILYVMRFYNVVLLYILPFLFKLYSEKKNYLDMCIDYRHLHTCVSAS